MGQTLHGRWRNASGHCDLLAQALHTRVYQRYVAEDVGTDAVFFVGEAVLEEGGAGISAFVVEVADLLVYALVSVGFDFVDREALKVLGLLTFGLRCHDE